MKTIAFHLNCLCLGGAERVVSNLANRFAKEGYKVYIATEWYDEKEYSLDEKVKRIHVGLRKEDEKRNRIAKFILRVKYLKEFVNEYKPDVLVSFAHRANYRALMAAGKSKTPVIVCVRANPAGLYDGFFDEIQKKWLLPKASGAVFQTKEQREFFAPFLQDNSAIILNPVNDRYLEYSRAECAEKMVVQHARLVDCKNQEMLCRAFIKVHDKHPDYKLRIIGGDSHDGTMEKLYSIIDENNAREYIDIYGESDSPEKELSKAEIYAFTSNHEGMPNAVLEAMVMGLPVISTDCPCGGPKELIENGKNGLLIPVGDENALEDKINYLIENKDIASQMGKEASKIREMVDEDYVFAQWKKYFEGVIDEAKKR